MIFFMPGRQVVVEIAVVLVPVRARASASSRSCQHLGGRVAEQPLGRRVHRLDVAVRLDGENGIDGRIENGTRSRLAVFQRAGSLAAGR